MSAVSAASHSESRIKPSVISERLRNCKSAAVSAALGKSDSWARKVADSECGVMLDDLPKFLRELGLKVVDAGKVCVPKDEYLAYQVLAAKYCAQPRGLEEDWE